MRFLFSLLLNGLMVYLASIILPGVFVENYLVAVIAGVVLGLINFFVKPVVTILTLPITVVTLGLFLFVINGAMVMLTDWFIAGFEVRNLLWGIVFSILLAILNMFTGEYEMSHNNAS